MDSLDVFSATCLYYFFVFVVFSPRGRRNKVIITVISPEVMSPVTRIMFKTQVKPFFDQRCRQWKIVFIALFPVEIFCCCCRCLFIFFGNAFLTAASFGQFMVERWSIEREFVGSTPGVGPDLSTMFTKAIRFSTSFPAHLGCRLILKTNEIGRNPPGN